MKWNETAPKVKWNNAIINKEQKENVVKRIVDKVKDGDVIGMGTGSTSYLATLAIAEKIKNENLNVLAIPAAYEIEMLCRDLGIPVTNLVQNKPDWGYDGADEVSPEKWLIKGRGGGLFKEKLIMASSPITYILVDESKFVNNLCEKFPIPVECTQESINLVSEKLHEMGASSIEMRLAGGKDGPVITEKGNLLLDVIFVEVNESLESALKEIPGVIETGLFMNYNIEVLS